MGKYVYIVIRGWCGRNIEISDIVLTTDSLVVAINECMGIGKYTMFLPETRFLFILECGSPISYSCDLHRGNVTNVLKSPNRLPSEILVEMGVILSAFIEEEKLDREEKEKTRHLSNEEREKKLLSELKAKYEQ